MAVGKVQNFDLSTITAEFHPLYVIILVILHRGWKHEKTVYGSIPGDI